MGRIHVFNKQSHCTDTLPHEPENTCEEINIQRDEVERRWDRIFETTSITDHLYTAWLGTCNYRS